MYTQRAANILPPASYGRPCSFSAETLVETKDGSVPIAMLEEGTYVLAYNEQTGEIGYYPIITVWAHEDPVIVYLTIEAETIVTTPEHPFYTDSHEWIEAGDLEPGEQIFSADGSYGQVKQVKFVARPQVMYDLTVADVHTFFVGEQEWLVHNCTRVQLREAGREGLPGGSNHSGPFRFRPVSNQNLVFNHQLGGYVDRFGNVWRQGPAHGGAFRNGFTTEWDVQLSTQGYNAWGRYAHRGAGGGWYVNVTPNGFLSH